MTVKLRTGAALKAISLIAAACMAVSANAKSKPPIIDVHMHAMNPTEFDFPPPAGMCTPMEMPVWDQRSPYGLQYMELYRKPPCKDPVWAAETKEQLLSQTLATMRKYNIYGVAGGTPEMVKLWKTTAPTRIWSGLMLRMDYNYPPSLLEELHAKGQLDVLAEVATQYEGIEPTDPQLEPYWAMAEKLDIPVGIHVGTGPQGVIYMGSSHYRARMHSALTMEEVLVKHPKLRVYLMHAGYPKIDDLLALMYAHPQVYVDTGVIDYLVPTADFHEYLRRIFQAGFGKRVMFGSDQMVWAGTIERAIRTIETARFLTAEQKRDVFYNNAARFLRLDAATIARQKAGGE